jgi:hypothetical protein
MPLSAVAIIVLMMSIEKCPICERQIFPMPQKTWPSRDEYILIIAKRLFFEDKLPCTDEDHHGPREKFRYE